MKKLRFSILVALLATSSSLSAAPTFQPSRTDTIRAEVLDLLGNCTKLDFMFKECSWQSLYAINHSGTITVPKGFRESPQTSIVIDGYFNKAFGDFRLSIDDVLYPLVDKNGEQAFVLPNGTNTTMKLAIVSGFSGAEYVEADTSAVIRKIFLRLDNTALVDSVLSKIRDQADKLLADVENYRQERRFLRFFTQTDQEIGQIKFNLTGRQAHDFSDDCSRPDRLLPDECGYLVSFNRYLRGDKSEFTEESKSKSFKKMSESHAELGKQITFLTQAKEEVLTSIMTSYSDTLAFIKAETNPQAEEPML